MFRERTGDKRERRAIMVAINKNAVQTQAVRIGVPSAELEADVATPAEAKGIVLFAHGSGSSRHSSRNRFVAHVLNDAGLATVLMDLLTEEEERAEQFTRHLRFDIGLLAGRLAGAIDWLAEQEATRALAVGLFGASTGGAAALVAAAERAQRVRAVVSRGGRPDLADDALPLVRAATLLIVGGADEQVIALNEEAFERLTCVKRLTIVPGATHLFEESGALEAVARMAADWFKECLGVHVSALSETARWTERNL